MAGRREHAPFYLPDSLKAWGTLEFEEVLKNEIERLSSDWLPLQQGLSSTSHALDGPFKAMVLNASDAGSSIRAKVGIFFSGIVAGCSCADDPTPVEAQNEYCELLFEINKATAEATVTLVTESR